LPEHGEEYDYHDYGSNVNVYNNDHDYDDELPSDSFSEDFKKG